MKNEKKKERKNQSAIVRWFDICVFKNEWEPQANYTMQIEM